MSTRSYVEHRCRICGVPGHNKTSCPKRQIELSIERPTATMGARCACGRWLPKFVIACDQCGLRHPNEVTT